MKPNSQKVKDSYTKRLKESGFDTSIVTQADYPKIKAKLGWSEQTLKTALKLLGRKNSEVDSLRSRMRDYIPTDAETQAVCEVMGAFGVVLTYLGCRIGEMWRMEIVNGDLVIDTQKDGATLHLPIQGMPDKVQEAVRLWVVDSRNISLSGIRHRWRNLCDSGAISRQCTPHSFRHRVVTQLLDSGAEITSVSKAMGHQSIQSTYRYRHNSPAKQVDLRNSIYGK